jgi:hypothetical protein
MFQGDNNRALDLEHRWLGRFQEDGTLNKLLQALIDTTQLAGLIDWERLATNGFFRGERELDRRLNMDLREKERQLIYW